jgi:rare lipoprotein A
MKTMTSVGWVKPAMKPAAVNIIVACIFFLLFCQGCSLGNEMISPTSERVPSGSDEDSFAGEAYEIEKISSDSYKNAASHLYDRTDAPQPSSDGTFDVRPYRVMGKWYRPLKHARGFRQVGVASWYGEDFHGKRTSSGEPFDMNRVSAAHKILPIGTYVRVRNLRNNREIDLRINDRGPFVAGRVIDLSKAAAKELGIYGPGTADVEVIALGAPAQLTAQLGDNQPYVPIDYYSGIFTVQVGAFGDLGNAKKLWKQMDQAYRHAHVAPYFPHTGKGRLYRVLVGRCASLELAEQYEKIMKQNGFPDAFLIAE